MGRVADSTIKGFMYQFNLTLKEVLESTDEIIKVEGIIEDIDKIFKENITAIQCKYHGTAEKFEWSIVYKPILQMIKSYIKLGSTDISFILYAYFPSEPKGEKEITKSVVQNMLNTTDIGHICNYIAYIKEIQDPEIESLVKKSRKTKEDKDKIKKYFDSNELNIKCNIDDFFERRFKFIIGQEYNELELENKKLLCQNGFSYEDAEEFAFPNAIQAIASLSIINDDDKRNITKKELVKNIKDRKSTSISRWTKELSNYKKLLNVRRRQMARNLNVNFRKRCFVFNPEQIENFEEEIVLFIKDYTEKYCSKAKLHIPAILCIQNYTKEQIDEIVSRLYEKGIETETGYRGNTFYPEVFLNSPQKKLKENWIQFKVKLCFDSKEYIETINRNKQDDLFQITEKLPVNLSTRDVNVEELDINNFDEIRYLLKLKNEVES